MLVSTAFRRLPYKYQPLSVKTDNITWILPEGECMMTTNSSIRSGVYYPVKPIVNTLLIGTIIVVAADHDWFKDLTDCPPNYIVKRVAGISVR